MIDEGWKILCGLLLRFLPFTAEELELLKPAVSTMPLKKGQAFAEEGKVAKLLAIIVHGDMRHYYTRDGIERTTYFYFEGSLVGAYFSCITGQPAKLTIEAITDCELLVFPYTALDTLFRQSHAWERFGRLLAEYIALGLEERMVTLLMMSPEERYQDLLASSKDKILARIPQHYIASYLGITPVSLSRIRSRSAQKQRE
jgi:CRP-like cAMP-binding protein